MPKFISLILCSLMFLLVFSCKKDVVTTSPVEDSTLPYWYGILQAKNPFYSSYASSAGVIYIGNIISVSAYKKVSYNRGGVLNFYRSLDIPFDYVIPSQIISADGKTLFFRQTQEYPGGTVWLRDKLFRFDSSFTKIYSVHNRIDAQLGGVGVFNFMYDYMAFDASGNLCVGISWVDYTDSLHCGLAVSADLGENFKLYFSDAIGGRTFKKIIPNASGGLYALMSDGKFLYAAQTGNSWTVLPLDASYGRISDFLLVSDQLYFATDNNFFRAIVVNGQLSISSLSAPAQVKKPIFTDLVANANGTIYVATDTLNLIRNDYSISNCFYLTKDGDWGNVTAYSATSPKMKIVGFDKDGKLIAFAQENKPFYNVYPYTIQKSYGCAISNFKAK